MEYDFFEEYMSLNNEAEKESEKVKYEKITQGDWEKYWEQNKDRNIVDTILEDGNLLGLIKGRAVCRGNVEIIRNLAAEFGIESIGIIGAKHIWNQVKLDGMWYDDDFTNYQSYLSQGNLDKSSKRFLCGQKDGKSEFSELKIYSKTVNKTQDVGKSYSMTDKKFLLNYGMLQEQSKKQSIQIQEKAIEEVKSHNGEAILSSAIEATEATTRESTMTEKSREISIMQKDYLMRLKKKSMWN